MHLSWEVKYHCLLYFFVIILSAVAKLLMHLLPMVSVLSDHEMHFCWGTCSNVLFHLCFRRIVMGTTIIIWFWSQFH